MKIRVNSIEVESSSVKCHLLEEARGVKCFTRQLVVWDADARFKQERG